jgi:hypothetical protein
MRSLNPNYQAGHSPQVVLRVPAPLLERVARFADAEFCSRSAAIRALLERVDRGQYAAPNDNESEMARKKEVKGERYDPQA